MRVAVISSAFPPFRAPETVHTILLCRELARRGDLDLHLITTSGLGGDEFPFSLHAVMPNWGWNASPTLVKTLRAISPDVVLLLHLGWIYDFHPMITMLPLMLRALPRRPALVTQFENIQDRPLHWPAIARRLSAVLSRMGIDERVGQLASGSQRLIVLNKKHFGMLCEVASTARDRTVVIPVPPLLTVIDDPAGETRRDVREELHIAPDEILLVFFGFVYASKGVETLLRALAAVQHGRRISLIVLGDVSEADYGESLGRLVADLSIGRRVRWLGHYDDPSRFLRAADIAVFPFDAGVQLNNSSFAGAAAYGLPIIATRGGDTEEEFRHGENAWLCPPQEPRALADAIVTLCENPELRGRLVRGGERFVAEHASLEHAISTTVATLRLAQNNLAHR